MSNSKQANGPLIGVKIVELSGIGPAPLCCALLSDMGADIIRIDRNTDPGLGIGRPNATDVTRRGRASVVTTIASASLIRMPHVGRARRAPSYAAA